MFYLEMSRDPTHGGGDWDFGKCLWSPSRKPNGAKWAFWETVLQVHQGDTVLHLRGKGQSASFVGFTTAESDGYETTERPPKPGQWSYAKSFYRVFLKDYKPFAEPIKLSDVFQKQEGSLRRYFEDNKSKAPALRRRLFYVIQSGKLQCLNGAYLSEVDDELANIILDIPNQYLQKETQSKLATEEVSTGERVMELKARLGQEQFSEQVRNNYNHTCCFPQCQINGPFFLVAGHIARWVNNPSLRGLTSNGICLCLLHDKAFELGLFTLTLDYRVWVNKSKAASSQWAVHNLNPFHGVQLKLGQIKPSEKAIRQHWTRHGIMPR